MSTGYFASHKDGRFTLLNKPGKVESRCGIKYSSSTGSTNDYDWLQLVNIFIFYFALQFRVKDYI